VRNRKGFTLLEVLLAVVLMVGGFMALSQAVVTGLFISGENEQEIVAANLAQERMEDIRNRTYALVTYEARAPVAGFTSFEREVVFTTPLANLKQVSVNVYWHSKSDELSFSLVTYVSDI
jgi:prepilin-type N-terminal cleavage/methylation domain-containing protein